MPPDDAARQPRLAGALLTMTTFFPFGEDVAAGSGLGAGPGLGEGEARGAAKDGGGVGSGSLLRGAGRPAVDVQNASDDEVVAVKPSGQRARQVSGPPRIASFSPQTHDC